jgi:hypothetical protein
MKVMLSSFGIADDHQDRLLRSNTRRPRQQLQRGMAIFTRLPPMDMRSRKRGLTLEYSLLVLCDQLLIDASSLDRLHRHPDPALRQVARTIGLLTSEGLLHVVDYEAILDDNHLLLEKMTDNDLRSPDQWLDTLANSGRIWSEFVGMVGPSIGLDLGATRAATTVDKAALPFFTKQLKQLIRADEGGHSIRETLRYYLTYVNANLILSNKMEAGLHDWADFTPFYQQKFLAVGHDSPPGSAEAEASRQLFSIAFPEFAIESSEQLVTLLKDRRIGELRNLISEASTGAVVFDEAFARSVLHEVFGIERKLAKERRLVGYLTLPVSFIPLVGTFAQLLVQEAGDALLERRLTKPYRWFYLLSDLGRADPYLPVRQPLRLKRGESTPEAPR